MFTYSEGREKGLTFHCWFSPQIEATAKATQCGSGLGLKPATPSGSAPWVFEPSFVALQEAGWEVKQGLELASITSCSLTCCATKPDAPSVGFLVSEIGGACCDFVPHPFHRSGRELVTVILPSTAKEGWRHLCHAVILSFRVGPNRFLN